MNKKDFIWNLIGSTIYAVTSMLLGTAVMRILNADAGGIFLFAFSTFGQHMYIVSYFGMRPIHVTDVGNKFSFGDYRRFRLITCASAVVFSVIFALIYAHNNTTKLLVIILMSLFKIADGLCDCYECEFQRDGRLDVTGMSLTARTLFVVAVFLTVMVFTRSLIASCVSAVAAIALAWAFCCKLQLALFDNVDYSINDGSVKRLFDTGKWLFLSAFIDMYIFSASKYAIDMTQSSAISGYFSLLFMPASFINLASNFIVRPLLTQLSKDYESGDTDTFVGRQKKICLIIAGITLAGMIGAYLLGVPVLGIFTGSGVAAKLMEYRIALVIIVLGGGFYAVLNLLYYALVIMDRKKDIFWVYVIGSVVATPVCYIGAKQFGINGASVGFALTMAFLTLLFYLDCRKRLGTADSGKN